MYVCSVRAVQDLDHVLSRNFGRTSVRILVRILTRTSSTNLSITLSPTSQILALVTCACMVATSTVVDTDLRCRTSAVARGNSHIFVPSFDDYIPQLSRSVTSASHRLRSRNLGRCSPPIPTTPVPGAASCGHARPGHARLGRSVAGGPAAKFCCRCQPSRPRLPAVLATSFPAPVRPGSARSGHSRPGRTPPWRQPSWPHLFRLHPSRLCPSRPHPS